MIVRLRRQYGQFITSGAQLLLLAVGARLESRAAWLACLALMALLSLFAWSSTLRRRRAMADTPTSRIASAAQGYVELRGVGLPLDGLPLRSRLSGLPCLWYRYIAEERSSDNKWQTIDQGESNASFILDDGSGQCVVDVDGAEILTRHKERRSSGRYRHTEWTLRIKDLAYAIGEFRTLGGGNLELDPRRDVIDLLNAWKLDRPTLLKRFDLDQDGQLSVQEWALARQAAKREVARAHRAARGEGEVNTLRSPTGGQLYLLSNLDPDRLTRRYLGWSIFHLLVFFGALLAFSWLAQQRF